jgi:hypothetical protein
MNFCFWPNNLAGEYEYEHMTKNLARILTENSHFFTPSYLKNINENDLKTMVFNDKDFSLLSERARILREIGLVMELYYDSKFEEFLIKNQYDAVKIVNSIIQKISGFRDEAIFNGE